MKNVMVAVMVAGVVLLGLAAAQGGEEREIQVKVKVPDAAWGIAIDAVYRVGGELWVVATLSRPADAMAAQVISTISDRISVSAPDLPLKYFVLGRTWRWKGEEPYTFLGSRDEIEEALRGAEVLYQRADRRRGAENKS
jgi:hypothetical protein